MNVSQVVHRFYGKDTLCHVESRDIFREYVVLHEHGHEIASRKELHDEIEVQWVLERIEQLDHPWRRRLGQQVTFRTDVGELGSRVRPGYTECIRLT
jgi:hypothetical protein